MRSSPSVIRSLAAAWPFLFLSALQAQAPDRTVEEIAAASRAAVVVIESSDRRGEARGEGSGFLVRSDGVVATNLHVIGEGRDFRVRLADGRTLKPDAILAFDRAKDLVLFQLEAKDVPALELGDSDALRPGQVVLAVGNPLGLGLSVVQGTIAEKREVQGRSLIQIAMPIEPGSSGSPLIDLGGRVVGVLAIKSGASTGFAVPANELALLLERRRSIPFSRWLTIGALDAGAWRPLHGGEWRQRAGRIVASGSGDGFGGRTLCLSEAPPPAGRFEAAVEVRLEDESGAAGIAFHSDGEEKHYGFYPTNGSVRLTRFEGPDVFTWTILSTVRSEHYRPGEWNRIKIRVDGSRLTGLVNDEVAIEVDDPQGLTAGKVGLVKFREPKAEFRGFRVGVDLPSRRVPAGTATEAIEAASRAPPAEGLEPAGIEDLVALGDDAVQALRERSRSLEKEAARLRSLANLVAVRAAGKQIREALTGKEEEIDLMRAALLLSKIDNPDLDPAPYLELVERTAREAKARAPEGASDGDRFRALIQYFFEDLGFRGSQGEYYSRSNSYLNEVLDDREGIPITLSLVFMEVARRLGLEVVGVGIPRHFVVELRPRGSPAQLVDVFGGGKLISRDEAEGLSGGPLADPDFLPASKRQIIVRMLRNLLTVAQREQDAAGMLRYLDVVLLLEESSAIDRWMRAMLRFQAGQHVAAAKDLDWLLEHDPPEVNRADVEELRELVRRRGG